jgi:hypothetical protein
MKGKQTGQLSQENCTCFTLFSSTIKIVLLQSAEKKSLQIFNLCWKVLQKTRECSPVPSIMFSCCSLQISNPYHIRTVKKLCHTILYKFKYKNLK